jgi:hypothetical protein
MVEFRPIATISVSGADYLSGTIAGRFVIGKRLGMGGMGEV